jgi:hyperosmotically inducible protein
MKTLYAILFAALTLPAYAQPRDDKPSISPSEEQAAREKNNKTARDAALTTKVHGALAADVGLKTMASINVDSDDGVVTLKGRVDSRDTIRRAGDVAKKVSGVKSVRNELQAKG